MEGSRRLSLVIGGFVLLTLGVLALILLSFSDEAGFLRPRYRLVTFFENVQGLTSGAPVRLAGKDVGIVESVSFVRSGEDLPPVRVVLRIDEAVKPLIRTDSVAGIGTIGLLGDKYVEISMGTGFGRPLEGGEDLASVSPLDLNEAVARGTEAIDNIATLTANVNQVVEEFGESMGGRRIAESAQAVSDIVKEIQEGDGLLHSLIYDRYSGSGVENIERSLATLEAILNEVADGDGLLHTLIYEPLDDPDVILKAFEAGSKLDSILGKVDSGVGSIGMLLNDPGLYRDLRSVAAKMAQGEGTIGLLVNDPTLYEDLKVLVGGAQRSFVVRSLIRMSTDGEY